MDNVRDLDGTTVLGLKLGALLGEKVGATDLLGAVVLGLQLGDLLGGIVGDELGDNVGENVLIGIAVVGLELGDIVGPEIVDRSPLGSMQRLIASAIVGCLHKVEAEL